MSMATAKRKNYAIEIDTEKIKKRMEKCGINQNEMAKKVGVSYVSISNILNNKQMPRVHIFAMISELVGEKMEDLLIVVK